jgi:predicted nucleic acid-binding protein
LSADELLSALSSEAAAAAAADRERKREIIQLSALWIAAVARKLFYITRIRQWQVHDAEMALQSTRDFCSLLKKR